MNDEKRIRKLYGEKMWHLCRSLFPSLLETEGLLSKIIEEHFNPSRFLYDDIIANEMEEKFKDYIYSFIDVENNNQIITNKSVKELLNEAGYEFYECHTEEDIQAFKKYYAPGEELCTFNGGRLNRCHVFFAIKKIVDNIKRENFTNPKREDEYGTSVISIQFSKGSKNTLSIKNRYNHKVNNPDATFSNNLENIIHGLTAAFEREYSLNITQNEKINFEIPGYVRANDGKWYKYNYEINNVYYCPDNIIIDNFEVKRGYQEKEKYLVIDYFILDLVNKEIKLYDKKINDAFIDCNKDFDKIKINNIDDGKRIDLIFKDGTNAAIIINNANEIISYSNNNIKIVGEKFLCHNKGLTSFSAPNATSIGDKFLHNNQVLTSFSAPNATSFGNGFLYYNQGLTNFSAPNVTSIGKYFLYNNQVLTSFSAPNATSFGDYFLYNNQVLNKNNFINGGKKL